MRIRAASRPQGVFLPAFPDHHFLGSSPAVKRMLAFRIRQGTAKNCACFPRTKG
jgi:hypothetical protein